MGLSIYLEKLYQKLLSKKTKERSERVILWIALVSFIIHLLIIGLIHFNIISINEPSNLLKNPIAAIYTPFSFILVYEVYLLIYYLPQSTSTYISKQYEIIALIIIRRLFKDLSDLSLSSNWFSIKNDLQFTYDLLASVLLFYLIYLFHVQRTKVYRNIENNKKQPSSISKFINAKKWIATALVPILLIIAIYSFLTWSIGIFQPLENQAISFKNINNIFFEQFFNILIIADVILLLFSFFHTDEFHKVIRNSGFIISTILIRLSFSVSGIINTVLIVSAILFGLLMLFIHNKFEKKLAQEFEKKLAQEFDEINKIQE
jgi:NADH:ubiquinone oxidoreductase subunit 6 (subunit J)